MILVSMLQVDSEEEEEPNVELSDRDCTADRQNRMHHRGPGNMTDVEVGTKVCGRQPKAILHIAQQCFMVP